MASKAKLNIVTAAELGRIFGRHRNTVAAWPRQGCPYIQKADKANGKDWQFDSAAVAQWREDTAVQDTAGDVDQATESELTRRKLAAETTMAELKAAQARGELASVDEFERQLTGRVIEVRQKLLQVAKRVEPADRKKREAITDEILQALAVLTDGTELEQ